MSCYSRILTLSHYNTPTREVYIFRSWGHLVLVRREERNRLHSREWVPPDISRLINLIVIQAGPEGDVQIAFWHYPGFSILSSACAINLGLFKTKSFLCRDTQICITKRNIFGLGVCKCKCVKFQDFSESQHFIFRRTCAHFEKKAGSGPAF